MAVIPPLPRLVRRRLLALARHVPAALDGDARAVHRARVASRRLREVLPILVLTGDGATGRTRKVLRRVTRALGRVRELDVALGLLSEPGFKRAPAPAAGLVRAQIGRVRASRRRKMTGRLAELDLSGVAAHLRARAGLMSESRRERRWRVALARRLARRVAALRDAVRAAGALYAPEALHRARVATKKLRYALELADETGAAPCRAELRALKRVQNTLGRLHDLQVLDGHVREIQAGPPRQSVGQARTLEPLARAIDRECRALHARYVALAPGVAELCGRVARAVVPQVRASAVAAAKPEPVKMTLVEGKAIDRAIG